MYQLDIICSISEIIRDIDVIVESLPVKNLIPGGQKKRSKPHYKANTFFVWLKI